MLDIIRMFYVGFFCVGFPLYFSKIFAFDMWELEKSNVGFANINVGRAMKALTAVIFDLNSMGCAFPFFRSYGRIFFMWIHCFG